MGNGPLGIQFQYSLMANLGESSGRIVVIKVTPDGYMWNIGLRVVDEVILDVVLGPVQEIHYEQFLKDLTHGVLQQICVIRARPPTPFSGNPSPYSPSLTDQCPPTDQLPSSTSSPASSKRVPTSDPNTDVVADVEADPSSQSSGDSSNHVPSSDPNTDVGINVKSGTLLEREILTPIERGKVADGLCEYFWSLKKKSSSRPDPVLHQEIIDTISRFRERKLSLVKLTSTIILLLRDHLVVDIDKGMMTLLPTWYITNGNEWHPELLNPALSKDALSLESESALYEQRETSGYNSYSVSSVSHGPRKSPRSPVSSISPGSEKSPSDSESGSLDLNDNDADLIKSEDAPLFLDVLTDILKDERKGRCW